MSQGPGMSDSRNIINEFLPKLQTLIESLSEIGVLDVVLNSLQGFFCMRAKPRRSPLPKILEDLDTGTSKAAY